jgi:murein DD-endopeptidase MepM/ murein hydrolase activator NlpD
MQRAAILCFTAGMTTAACGAAGPAVSGVRSAAHDIELRLEVRTVAARVIRGMTLASLLDGQHIAADQTLELIAAIKTVFDPRKVRVAQPYRVAQTLNGELRSFEYEIDGNRLLQVGRPNPHAEFVARVVSIPKISTPQVVSGAIDRSVSSLFAAVDAAGGNVDLAMALADVFAGEIDFNTELQPGDRFTLLVDRQARDDHAFAGYGPILAAEFDNADRHLRAVRYAPDGGMPDYFDERGASLRRFLLRSPLKFDPIVTSGFSRSRLHPVLLEKRAHLGVDYKAPVGAPVVAVADGVVVSAGMSGDAGRMVHLRHSNGLESEYLHLSVVTVAVGTRVHQGDLIGRVGATGLATGPHLDYRVKKNGAFINPLTAARAMPPAEPVPAGEMSTFAAVRDRVLTSLTASSARRSSGDSGSP